MKGDWRCSVGYGKHEKVEGGKGKKPDLKPGSGKEGGESRKSKKRDPMQKW